MPIFLTPNLAASDSHLGKTLPEKLYLPAQQLVERTPAHGQKLYAARRECQAFQLDRLESALGMLSNLVSLLGNVTGSTASPSTPPGPP